MTHQSPTPFRAWSVVLAAVAINLILGVLYAWGVMLKALVQQWHWTVTQASLPFTVSAGCFAFMMIFAGRWQDKIGPRYVAMSGGVILGLGLIASSWVRTPQWMWLTFGLVGGFGIGLGYSATTPPAIKWFAASRKGLITGIVVSGVGLAAVYIAPLTHFLLAKTSIPQTFLILGVGTIVLTVLLSFALANPPAGYVPAARESTLGAARSKPSAAARPDQDWQEMLRTPQFYQLWILFVLAASAGLMLISQIAYIAKVQAHIEWGFLYVAMLALFNTLGRLMSGFLSDRIGRSRTLLLALALQAVNIFAFAHYTTAAWLLFGCALAGLCYGTCFTLFPATTADFYGVRNLGVNYGLVFTGFGVAGIIGPILGGKIHDAYGSYALAFDVSTGMLVLGIVFALTLRPPKTLPLMPAARPAPAVTEVTK